MIGPKLKLFAPFLAGLLLIFSVASPALAAINYNDIISDAVFDNYKSMTATDINNFLNSFPDSCISPKNGFTTPDPIGVNETDYKFGSKVSAGKAIYDVAQGYQINPQVILTTLQKEQGLVTGGSFGCHSNTPDPSDTVKTSNSCTTGSDTSSKCTMACTYAGGCMTIAMGYNCPYYCYAASEGFHKQLVLGTWILKFARMRAEGNVTWDVNHGNWVEHDSWYTYYGPMADSHGKKVQRCSSCTAATYDGTDSLGDGTVRIANGATAALYNYTPFKSGNTRFYNIFVPWFGDTHYIIGGSIKEYYDANNGSTVVGLPLYNARSDGEGMWWQGFENGYIIGQHDTGYWYVKGSIGNYYAANHGASTLGAPLGISQTDGNGLFWQKFENGYIVGDHDTGYWSVKGSIGKYYDSINGISALGKPLENTESDGDGVYQQEFQNGYIVGSYATGYWQTNSDLYNYWVGQGRQNGDLGLPTGLVTATADNAGKWQRYQHGYIIWSAGTGAWESMDGPIRDRWSQLGLVNGSLGYPIGPVNATADGAGKWQQYQNGYIIWSKNSGAWESTSPLRDRWEALGLVSGSLGYPTGPVTATADNAGKWQRYQHGYIIWSAGTGAWESMDGPIRDKWKALGLVSGSLGYPTGAVQSSGGTSSQAYEGGTIYHSSTKTWVVT